MEDRKVFLIELYKQLCNEIDRHIKIIWQIVGVLLSAFAIFALVEKNILTIDIASTILILVCGLSIAITIESNYWYNRNLVIIANIERQFLFPTDSKDIHYYFINHRKDNAYLDMMVIQMFFIIILLIIVVLYHFFIQVFPFIHLDISHFYPIKTFPYLTLIIEVYLLFKFHLKRKQDYNKFKDNSPGITVHTGNKIDSNSDHVT